MRRPGLVVLALIGCTPATQELAQPAAIERDEPAVVAAPVVAEAAPVAAPPVADDGRCKCPGPAAAEDTDDDEHVDEDPKARRARAKRKLPGALAARLRARLPGLRPACDVTLSGPCDIRSDLDGDGELDDAVLVRDAAGAAGIAILWGAGGAEQLGAGRRGQCWKTTEVPDVGDPPPEPCAEEVAADLDWLASWAPRKRRVDPGGPVLAMAIGPRLRTIAVPGALGDALYLGSSDVGVVLYRSADGWILMHLGF